MSASRRLTRAMTDYANPRAVGSRLRARRIGPLLDIVRGVYGRQSTVSIIDIGGTDLYWRIVPEDFLERHDVRITMVNLPGNGAFGERGRFLFREGDGCDLSEFGDRSFDIAHSNSVLEHVGGWDRKVRFAREVYRVASRSFVQTPNFWFPLEPHCMTPFFHWLPGPSRIWLVSHFALGHWPRATSTDQAARLVESARLVNRGMMKALFPGSIIRTERVCGLAKSLIAIRA